MLSNEDLKILEVIKNNVNPESSLEKITLDSPISSLGLSSINFIKIVVVLENEFGFEFNDEELNISHFGTVQELIHYVKNK